MNQSDWLREIGEAADELGYGITDLTPNSIQMVRLGQSEVKVEIESIFLSGNLLRNVLRPVPLEKKS
jgi:hypothetical protein